jgi:hypothetical protein
MTREKLSKEDLKGSGRKPQGKKEAEHSRTEAARPGHHALGDLQRKVGNQAVQRLVQRSAEQGFELDEETAGRIDRARSGGEPLTNQVQKSMGEAMGEDFSEVRIHTSPEADDLNQQLSAKAFTTGKDIFFREGEYDPYSTGGKQLLAHELTHVSQQKGADLDTGGPMSVNAPGDRFEQEADTTAEAVVGGKTGTQVRRQEMEEEEVQMQPMEEEEEMLQMQVEPEEEEEEEAIQMQVEEEEEEELQV